MEIGLLSRANWYKIVGKGEFIFVWEDLMYFVNYIIDFFQRLVRGKIDEFRFKAQAKAMGASVRAKSAAANKFNKAVDGAAGKARKKKKK